MKKIIKILITLSFLLILTPLISANEYVLVCLQKGQTIFFSECNPLMKDRTCGTNIGCPWCTIQMDSGVYCPAFQNKCYYLGLSCTFSNSTQIDQAPPELTVYSPAQDAVYQSRAIYFDIDVNELSYIQYYDNIFGRGRWNQVCNRCYGYNYKRYFKEGFNNITFKAYDPLGNTAYHDVTFYVDSKKPRIRYTNPRRGFADGNFHVRYDEENPESLKLYYGNSLIGYRNSELDFKTDCYEYKRGNYCEIYIPLEDYDGQEIEYWYNITDIAGNFYANKPTTLEVDTTEPIIEDLNYYINGRYVTFNISITEDNFDSVEYIDNTDLRPRWRTLCRRLRDGVCIKKKSFRTGQHDLDIQVTDEARNAVGESISFLI